MEEHANKIGIKEGHSLVQTNTTWKAKKGQDTDTYWYDELDGNGEIVAKYIVKDSTSMHPPFSRSITYESVSM